MIKTLDQCKAVQRRRVSQKKRGYAKAVRTFVQKNHHDEYRQILDSLPVTWEVPEEKE